MLGLMPVQVLLASVNSAGLIPRIVAIFFIEGFRALV